MIINKLVELRKSRKITQQQLAKEIGVSKTWLHKIEGGANPTIEIMEKLSRFFQVDMNFWFTEESLQKISKADIDCNLENEVLREMVTSLRNQVIQLEKLLKLYEDKIKSLNQSLV